MTGGGSRNRVLMQIIADVFGCDVSIMSRSNSACIGAGLAVCKHILNK